MDALRTRLAEVLAAYGADPARWPASEREQLMAVADKEPHLVAEAREIDQVLVRAKSPIVPQGAAARLLERAGLDQLKPKVIALDRARARPGSSPWSWGAAAALAASFAFGIFIGTANISVMRSDGDVVEIDDPIVLTGIDDATDLLEGDG
jgi:hypothetical protein